MKHLSQDFAICVFLCAVLLREGHGECESAGYTATGLFTFIYLQHIAAFVTDAIVYKLHPRVTSDNCITFRQLNVSGGLPLENVNLTLLSSNILMPFLQGAN